jgi:hypothetical protein
VEQQLAEGRSLMLTSHFRSLFRRRGELTKRFSATIIASHSSHKTAEITGRPQMLFLNSGLCRVWLSPVTIECMSQEVML